MALSCALLKETTMASPRRSIRMLVLLLATVLAVPLTAIIGVSPAHAVDAVATGHVSDGFGAPLAGVTVTARGGAAYDVPATHLPRLSFFSVRSLLRWM